MLGGMAPQVTTGRFVGRAEELARLRELLARAADGRRCSAGRAGSARRGWPSSWPVGYVYRDGACELPVCVLLGIVRRPSPPRGRSSCVLPRLAYLALCRSIQLFALLARGDAAKGLEMLVLCQELTVPRRQVPRPRLEPADRALLTGSAACCHKPAGPLLGHPRDPALASAPGRWRMHLLTYGLGRP